VTSNFFSFETEYWYVDQARLELVILPPPPPECWDYKIIGGKLKWGWGAWGAAQWLALACTRPWVHSQHSREGRGLVGLLMRINCPWQFFDGANLASHRGVWAVLSQACSHRAGALSTPCVLGMFVVWKEVVSSNSWLASPQHWSYLDMVRSAGCLWLADTWYLLQKDTPPSSVWAASLFSLSWRREVAGASSISTQGGTVLEIEELVFFHFHFCFCFAFPRWKWTGSVNTGGSFILWQSGIPVYFCNQSR
jgi:hypothetical protein